MRNRRFKGRPAAERRCACCGGLFAQELKMTKRRFCTECRVRRDKQSDARAAARYRIKLALMSPDELEAWEHRKNKPEWSGDWDSV